MSAELEVIEVFRSRLYAVKGDRLTEKVRREGRHEWAENSLMPLFLQEGATVYDVGANIGYYTSLFSLWVGQSGHVHAFEANPKTADILQQSIELNDWKNVALIRAAVSEARGEVHVWKGNLEGRAGGNIAGWRLRDSETGEVAISTVSLDEHMVATNGRRPSFVKIDVEGFEVHVLRGASQVLKCGAVFMVEFMANDDESFRNCVEVADRFHSTGYTLANVGKKPVPHLVRVGSELSAPPFHHNIFCLPKTHEFLCR